MSTLYVILGVIVASIIATTIFVVVGAIEHRKHININWLLVMICIILSATLVMVLIYHNQNDKEIAQTSYNNGYEAGVADTQSTTPSNDEMEAWFSATQDVVIGTNGTDYAVHIIDGNGEEWVLYADSIQTK